MGPKVPPRASSLHHVRTQPSAGSHTHSDQHTGSTSGPWREDHGISGMSYSHTNAVASGSGIGSGSKNGPYRQSTQESAKVAEGIFDLYGGGERERDSVVSAASDVSYVPRSGGSGMRDAARGSEGAYGMSTEDPRDQGRVTGMDGAKGDGQGHRRVMSDASTSTLGLPYDREPELDRAGAERGAIVDGGEQGQEILQSPADTMCGARPNGRFGINDQFNDLSVRDHEPRARYTQPQQDALHAQKPPAAALPQYLYPSPAHPASDHSNHSYPGPIDFTASPTTPLFHRPETYADSQTTGNRRIEDSGASEGRDHVLDSPTGVPQAGALQRNDVVLADGEDDRGRGDVFGPASSDHQSSLGARQEAPRLTITPDVTPHKQRHHYHPNDMGGVDDAYDGNVGSRISDGTRRADTAQSGEGEGNLRLSTMTNATTTTASTSLPSTHSHPPSRNHTPSASPRPSPSPSPIPDRLHPHASSSSSTPSRLPVPPGVYPPHGRDYITRTSSALDARGGKRESLASSVSHGSLGSHVNGSQAGSVRTYLGESEDAFARRVQLLEPRTEQGEGREKGHREEGRGYAQDQGMGNVSTSQFSHVGSTRGKGEDEDAWHVRSTYARLENEGVFGDGWDPGVERTRGGPSMASKRQTVLTPRRGSEVGDKEKSYLASLDRYGFVQEPLRDRNESRLALIPSAPLARIPKLPRSSPLKPSSASASATGTNGHGGGAPTSAMAMAARGPDGEPPSPPIPPSARMGQGRASVDGQGRAIGGAAGSSRRGSAGGNGQGSGNGDDVSKEVERTEKWMKMMGVKRKDGGNAVEWVWKGEGVTKLRRRIYKGVPDRWRMAAWWTLAEDAAARDASGAAGPSGQSKGKKRAEELEADYRHAIDLPSPHDVQIDLDVPRTISGHTLFVTRYGSGQRSLFHVLHSFSLLCDTCGYCQGMGPLAATFLCYFDPERTYALMVRLHDQYGMHDIFAPGFPGLLEAFYVMERMMEWIMPDVYKTFRDNMISTSAWATKWYITLFVNTVPFSTQLRIWDALLLDGRDVIIITALTILWAYKDLLAHPRASFESILSLLSSHYVPEDEDAMMRWVKRMLHQQGVRARMDGWREEWGRLKREGKDGEALL